MKSLRSKLSPLAAVISEGRLTRRRDLLAQILRDIPDAVLLVDARGHIIYRNEGADKLFELAPDDAPRIIELFTPEARDPYHLRELWRQLEEAGRLENVAVQLQTTSGRVLDVISSQTAIRDEDGRMMGYSAVVKDISSIRESERRVERRNAQLLAYNAVAQAITEQASVEPLLVRVLDAILGVIEVNAGCVHLLEEDSESLVLLTQRSLSPEAAHLVARYAMGEGVIGQAAVLREMLIVTDMRHDKRLARRTLADMFGSLAAIPLVTRGSVRGVITLFHDTARAFTAHEQGMLAAIGRQVGVALDHARLFDEVTQAQRAWESTFDALTDGVSVHATSGRIQRANKALANMFGMHPEELVGVRCCELYHGSKKPRPNCTIMRTVTRRQAQRVELTDRLHGRVLRVTTDPIINARGHVTGVVCTTRDVTDEKLLERRLVQQERISAIGEVAAGIAHEVGTPLNIISANVQFMLRRGTPESREELEAIREQTHGITRLVRQLLDFARDREPTFEPVNVNELIEKTVGLLAHQLNHADIVTELSLAPYIPAVDGDAAQLQQVLFNIINNARQAMEDTPRAPGAAPHTLRIATDSSLMPTEAYDSPHIIVTLSDTGRGIPSEALPHVFKPFFTANKEGGTGLGLAISHRIIQAHSGLMSIQNRAPRGTLIRLLLPLSQKE